MLLPDRFPASRADFRLRARFRRDLKPALLDSGSHLLVAVSGGGDSIALLALIALEARRRHFLVTVGHVDHALRPGSEIDGAFVEATAGKLGLACRVVRLTASPPAGESIEAWARRERRRELRAMAREIDARWILLGHTRDDQAETVLLNLLRGSGLRGLTGMRAMRAPILRPLLDVSRGELRAFLARHHLEFREDPSNLDLRFRRNRVRRELLPFIEAGIEPAATRLLARTAAGLLPIRRMLERQVRRAWRSLGPEASADGIRLERARLASYDRVVIEGCLLLGIERLTGSAQDVKHSHLCSLTDAALAGRPASFQLPHGVKIEVDAAEVRFRRKLGPLGATG